MELPQPRPFETEGRKPSHDFLSLYNHSNLQQDSTSRPPPSQGGYPKTHDFLQPLERLGKARGGSSVDTSSSEKPPPSVDHHELPGGIGTYTIGRISYFDQRVPKPEASPMFTVAGATNNEGNTGENSNCISFGVSGFTLWEESTVKKGETREENVGDKTNIRDAATKLGQWPVLERPARSSTNIHRSSYNSRSSSQELGRKTQRFMDMIWSAKGSSQDDEFDDHDEDFIIKKESPSTCQKDKLDLRVREDGKNTGKDQKPNTPRSKHSATEQRRRSKINDGFQMLRQLIPNGDQKRDKASFLLEAIEYIQFLQQKIIKYEGNIPNSQTAIENAQNHVMDHHIDQQQRPGMVNKATVAFPLSLQPTNFLSSSLTGNPGSQFHVRTAPEAAAQRRPTSQIQPQSCPILSDGGKLKEREELAVNGGTINISSVYSQGLLETLTQALQNSGVDLSKASISVQIQLGKQLSVPSTIKDGEVHRPGTDTRDEGYDQNPKRLKMDRN